MTVDIEKVIEELRKRELQCYLKANDSQRSLSRLDLDNDRPTAELGVHEDYRVRPRSHW